MEVSDKALIQRTVKGDQHAYSQLVRRYQSQLRHSLRQLCAGDEGLADDMAQEAFMKAYRALQSFRGDAKFSTWLYRIAYNLTVSHFRKQRPEVNQELVDAQEEAGSGMGSIDAGRDLDLAMSQLSEDQRSAIHLCLQRGFSHQEAADIMNLPLGTVKTHVLRGKEKLKQMLTSWQGEVAYD